MGKLVHGVYTPDIDLTNLNKMKEVIIMGNLQATETSELVYAVGKIVSSAKEAKENDGKITAGDAILLMDDVIPLFNGIKGADKIPAEFYDGWDEADMAQIEGAWKEGSTLHPNDTEAVVLALEVVRTLQELLLHVGAIAPSAPPVE